MIDWLKRSAMEPQIDLNGVTLPIALRRHHSARRLTLRMAPDGSEVRITLPAWARAQEAIAFAHARREWLEVQHGKVPRREAPRPGGDILYRGNKLQIAWEEKAPRRPQIAADAVRLGGPANGIATRLQRWLEKEALALFEADMHDYTTAAALDPVPVALSRAQRRWGSCSDKSRIRLNWRLVQAPDFVRRSVVAHEVTHLVHFDHSPAFHALLDEIYDDNIRKADRWLKDNGRSLYASFG